MPGSATGTGDQQRSSGEQKKQKKTKPASSSEAWRSLMQPTRNAAAKLCDEGVLQATQKGQVSMAKVMWLLKHFIE